MLYQKYVPYNEELEKTGEVHDYLFQKDGELKNLKMVAKM